MRLQRPSPSRLTKHGRIPCVKQSALQSAQLALQQRGSWACARHGAPYLRASGSSTFLTGGVAARPKMDFAAVTSASAAVEALSGSLALKLARIRVKTIRPGFVDTDIWVFLPAKPRDSLRKKVEETFPARRAGRAEEIGHAALFLMTNPYATGTVVEVSGVKTWFRAFPEIEARWIMNELRRCTCPGRRRAAARGAVAGAIATGALPSDANAQSPGTAPGRVAA